VSFGRLALEIREGMPKGSASGASSSRELSAMLLALVSSVLLDKDMVGNSVPGVMNSGEQQH
jgi:hypothetical protein